MTKFLMNQSRLTLVLLTTLLSIMATFVLMFVGYKFMGITLRHSEMIIGICAPLFIASSVTWYLYGLIKKLNFLEKELRLRISKEKEEIYLATIQGAQHITNNLLNGLLLIEMEMEEHSDFDKETIEMLRHMVNETKKLITDLSSVKKINADKIKEVIVPKTVDIKE